MRSKGRQATTPILTLRRAKGSAEAPRLEG